LIDSYAERIRELEEHTESLLAKSESIPKQNSTTDEVTTTASHRIWHISQQRMCLLYMCRCVDDYQIDGVCGCMQMVMKQQREYELKIDRAQVILKLDVCMCL
jgi:hypothetical protein